jgi:hypothetical protein
VNRGAPRASELQRHIACCRRRGERASVLVARMSSPRRSAAHRVADCFRMTDSVSVSRIGHGYTLVGVFDDDGLDRRALERRVRAIAGVEMRVAWVRFPDDGVTLDALFQAAWTALRCSAAEDRGAIVARVPA